MFSAFCSSWRLASPPSERQEITQRFTCVVFPAVGYVHVLAADHLVFVCLGCIGHGLDRGSSKNTMYFRDLNTSKPAKRMMLFDIRA